MCPVDLDALVSSEFPLQVLDFQYPFVVHAEIEPPVVACSGKIDGDVSVLASEIGFRGVQFVPVHVLSSQDHELGFLGIFMSSCLGIGFGRRVACEEGHFAVDHGGDVVPGLGLGSGPEFGFG